MSADQTNSAGPPNRLRVRIRAQEHEEYEFEAEGSPEFVRASLKEFLRVCGLSPALPEEKFAASVTRAQQAEELRRKIDRAEGMAAGLEAARRSIGEPEKGAAAEEHQEDEPLPALIEQGSPSDTGLTPDDTVTGRDLIRRQLAAEPARWWTAAELREVTGLPTSTVSPTLYELHKTAEAERRRIPAAERAAHRRAIYQFRAGGAPETETPPTQAAAEPTKSGGGSNGRPPDNGAVLAGLAAADGKQRIPVRWTGKVAVAIMPDGRRIEQRGPRDEALRILNLRVGEILRVDALRQSRAHGGVG